jgi:tryptophanyl-tRNA synthetase
VEIEDVADLRAAELRAHPERLREILHEGGRKARAVARETLDEARELMGLAWDQYTPGD